MTVIATLAPAAIVVPAAGAPVTEKGAVGSFKAWTVCVVEPVLVKVTDELTACDPPGTVPKLTFGGEVPIGTVGACPVPLTGMVATPLSVVALKVPVTRPSCVGVKVMGTVIVAPSARLAGSGGVMGVPTVNALLSMDIAETVVARVAVNVTDA